MAEKPNDQKNPHAQLRALKLEAAVSIWEDILKTDAGAVNRRFGNIGVVSWFRGGNVPLDLFSLLREARVGYTLAQYLGAIMLSTAAVELIMNKDRRTAGLALHRMDSWATLNNSNLALVQPVGLPVSALLSAGESIADGRVPIAFVRRQNKVVHGDFSSLIRRLSEYDPIAESEALDQVLKAERFVVEWFNTAPDVQDGHIQNHEWPA
jgi:hypothetical protein